MLTALLLTRARKHFGTVLLLVAVSAPVFGSASYVRAEADVSPRPSADALMQAVAGGKVDAVKVLIGRGAEINPHGAFHGQTPLTQAAATGRLDVVAFLVEHGADVNANCTEHGSSGYLRYEGIGPRNPTPLGSAAEPGRAAVVEYLIQKGAKVNGRDGSTYTPLMWACAGGDLKTVQVLLHHGADAKMKTDQGQTARSFAAARNYAGILASLDAAGKK